MTDLVIPTIGRPSLALLLDALAASSGPLPDHLYLVDDRRDATEPLPLGAASDALRDRIVLLRGAARGPAAARNRGWRASSAEWIAFLDDDVVPSATWLADVSADVAACDADVAGSQGVVDVPLPARRRPTDWERNVANLANAQWITADCAYRRSDLAAVDGFDERFPRAFREDADLALRVTGRGRRIVRGRRRVTHPVRPAGAGISIALQAGNADDVLMEALHGNDWYERAGAPRGAFRAHLRTVACGTVAALAGAAWLASTLRFAWQRIAPGPRTAREIATMLGTSLVLPFAAVAHRCAAYLALPDTIAAGVKRSTRLPGAVLFDRDGTLVEDVPFNGEPAAVRPLAGARAALSRLRAAGVPVGIISNQSGIAKGLLTAQQVAAVNARLAELVGPFDTIQVCPHGSGDGCGCRKPAPGMIVEAARALGVRARDCVVIGDIGADIDAAHAAGAAGILVPTAVTLPQEVAAAPLVVADLAAAVDLVLGSRP